MAEKMIVTLDGSQFAEAALRYAENLVDKLVPKEQPEVTLLMVMTPHIEHINVEGGTVDIPEPNPELETQKTQCKDYLEKSAETLRQKGVTVNTRVMNGEATLSPADAIIAAEKEIGADLVVMSTHGRRGITRWAIGSVTEKVLRGGTVPVLMVRAR